MAAAIAVHVYIDADGLAGNPAPAQMWAWIVLTGAAVGVYLRKLQWAGPQPLQTSHNGLNCVELNFVASSDPAGASEPTRAAVVMGFA